MMLQNDIFSLIIYLLIRESRGESNITEYWNWNFRILEICAHI